MGRMGLPEADWLALCRRAAHAAREAVGGGSATARVIVDPVDGSVNAKRELPFACVSIAVASGERMEDVEVGFVAELVPARDWWAVRGEGAFCDGERLA